MVLSLVDGAKDATCRRLAPAAPSLPGHRSPAPGLAHEPPGARWRQPRPGDLGQATLPSACIVGITHRPYTLRDKTGERPMSQTEPVTGAEFLARSLATNGTTHVFFIDAVL